MAKGKSLAEYAAEHPFTGTPAGQNSITETARSYAERMDELQTIDVLMQTITKQLKQGTPPQYILYSAVDAIGILTHNEEWHNEANKILCETYSDLAQQSLLREEEATAAERLEALQTAYNNRLRKNITQRLKGYQQIEKALTEALAALNAIDPAGAENAGAD